jgi:D-lactate dehydrogenase (cytochrome)
MEPRIVAELEARLDAARVSTRPADRDAAAGDESALAPVRPDVVGWPETTEEVAAVVTLAAAERVPVTARGAGSSLEGNPIPVRGGIVLDLTRMARVVAVRADDLQADVQPGVVYDELNRQLRPHGLFFPPSPGGSSDVATIGGMVANNASGIYSVKYGGTRSHVLAATVVTGTGAVVRLGNRCRKSSSGYHLIGLLVGSEGTLAIASELTHAIADCIRYGIDLAAVEFLDRRTVAALNAYKGFGLTEAPTLLVEVHGSAAVVDETWAAADALCRERGGAAIALPGDRDPWEIRHHVTRAIQAPRPDAKTVRADLAFPIAALPALVAEAYRIADARGCVLHTFGHAGIGILHALIRVDERDAARWAAAQAAKDDLVAAALACGGSASGEHGMGLGNRKYAAAEHGAALELMKGIKGVFDPGGVLNPGKIW